MLDFTCDYPPTEREMHAAEDGADLAPESADYRNWAKGAAVEGPPDDDDMDEECRDEALDALTGDEGEGD